MAPDLNTLPASSRSNSRTAAINTSPEVATMRGQTPSPIQHSGSTSLQAAAAVNAGLHHEVSRRTSSSSNTSLNPPLNTRNRVQGRRRSTVLMNLQLNDPNLPPPGEMINEGQVSSYRTSSPHSMASSPIVATGDPHHNRAPSLGEIHQELEQEQEAQNRLLHMIRTQQQQLQQLQLASGQSASQPPVIDDSTPTSERSMSFQPSSLPPPSNAMAHSPTTRTGNPRASFDISRGDSLRSRTPSRTASPRMRATSINNGEGESWTLPPRDESAFYQAETQMLTRENQMLRMRIRELERQVNEFNANSAITHEPATPSHLIRSRSITEEENEGRPVGLTPATGAEPVKDE